MSGFPSDWAINRAILLMNEHARSQGVGDVWSFSIDRGHHGVTAFACYIEEHEEPVDPLLIEARELCAADAETIKARVGASTAAEYRAGHLDNAWKIGFTQSVLRRGIEIAKGGEA